MELNKKIKSIIFMSIASVVVINILHKNVSGEEYPEDKIYSINELVKPTIVTATLIEDTDLYRDIDGQIISKIYSGTEVEILEDKGRKWYLVKNDEQRIKGYVKGEYLSIPENSEVNTNYMSKEELESYVNINGFISDTNYLVWVDIGRQVTNVFKGVEKNWKLQKSILSSTGDNKSPTTRGYFKISEKGEWFYSERLGSGAQYWVRFNGSYLFHSVAMDKNKNVIDPRIGEKCSNGCVRMSLEDIKWFYNNIDKGTLVYIN